MVQISNTSEAEKKAAKKEYKKNICIHILILNGYSRELLPLYRLFGIQEMQ